MTREFKFRAWHIKAKEMLFEEAHIGDVFRWKEEKQPIIIMQYTGLKDKNNKEIYEGDIIQWEEDGKKHTVEVIFKYGCFCADDEPRLKPFLRIFHNIEVIGNIYENPNLLP